MSERLLLQFRLVPFSISPHTAKGRLKHLCALLAPSLWLINYVLPQRGHREAQRFLELGLRPRRPRLTAEGVSTCRRQSRSDGYGGAQNISAPSLRPLCGENCNSKRKPSDRIVTGFVAATLKFRLVFQSASITFLGRITAAATTFFGQTNIVFSTFIG